MKTIIKGYLEVQVYKYESEQEMKNHIETMKNENWKCKRKGKYMLSTSSNFKDYCNEDNWFYMAEFHKQNIKSDNTKHTSYESEAYWFRMYN